MNNDKALTLLQDMVKVDTVYGNEKELSDMLEPIFKEKGFETEQVEYSEGRTSLVATYDGKSDGPVLAYSGHLDVVPVGDVEWDYGPFSAEISDGKLYGRGTCDMKSGLVSAIAGVFRYIEETPDFPGSIKFLITMGEETSSLGAGQLVDTKYAEDVDAMIINEPTDLKIGLAHKGALWPRITTFGKTSHGSMPQEGVNAIDKLIKVMNTINEDERFDFEKAVDEQVGHSTKSLNKFNGGKGTNVVPDKATLDIDIRTVDSQDHEEIKANFENVLEELSKEDKDFKYEIEYINDLVALKTSPDDPFVKVMQDSTKEVLGEASIKNPAFYTDASKFVLAEKDFPIIIMGPGLTEMAHQPNEFVEVDKFYKMIKINQKATENYFN